MSDDLIGKVMGSVVTPVGHDGTDFRNLIIDTDGRLWVRVYQFQDRIAVSYAAYVSATIDYVQSGAVPSGEFHNITVCSFRDTISQCTRYTLWHKSAAGTIRIYSIPNPTLAELYTFTASLWLKPGDQIRFEIDGGTIGDPLTLALFGGVYFMT